MFKKNRKIFFALIMASALIIGNGQIDTVLAAKANIKVKSLSFTTPKYSNYTIEKGKTAKFKVSVSPSNATNKKVKWKTSNKKVVSVSSKGVIKGIKNGTATITAEAQDGSKKKVSCKVTVGIPVESIYLDNTQISMIINQTHSITAKVLPDTAGNKELTYKSSDEDIVKVDDNGILTALRLGDAVITIQSKDGTGIIQELKVKVTNNDLVLTGEDVTGGMIILSNKTYDNIIIKESVGKAKLLFYNVSVNDTLTMEGGALYTLQVQSSKINKVVSQKSSNMSAKKVFPGYPIAHTLLTELGTTINSIDVQTNTSIHRIGNSSIGPISVNGENNTIMLDLEGITGSVNVNAPGGSALIDLTNCQIETVTVNGAVTLSDTGSNSYIKTLNIDGVSGNTILDTMINEVNISATSRVMTFTINRSISKLTNMGLSNNFLVNTNITNFISSGYGGIINGSGEVAVLTIEGSSTAVNVKSPKIVIGNYVTGTIVGGRPVNAGATISNPLT